MEEKGILIIHDDPFHRDMIPLCLTNHGFCGTFVVEDLEKGLKLLQTLKPAIVVISDAVLKTSGSSAGQKIREVAGVVAKIVVLGDSNDKDSREKAQQIGADDFAEEAPDALHHYAHLLRSIKGFIQ